MRYRLFFSLLASLKEALRPGADFPHAVVSRNLRSGFLLAAVCSATAVCSAQYRASIEGVVTDAQGAAVPGATLALTDESTKRTLTVKSGGHGNYNFNALPADTFRLTVTANGFSQKTLNGVTIIPEQPNTLNLKLDVGSASEAVDVNSGEVPALDTATASISGTITSNQIEHLPSFGRDVFRLISLAPGTFGDNAQTNTGNAKNMPGENQAAPQAADAVFKTENNPQSIGAGGQVNTNNILIDGVSTSSANWAGASVITPTEESVEYLKVSPNAYDAEFGRFSGSAVQITSKSGTNVLHGSAFLKASRPGLNAYQRWNGANSIDPANAGKTPALRNLLRDPQRFNQYGGSLGGPLWRGKLFAFFAYEGLQNRTTSTVSGLYETPSYDGSAPAGSNAAKYLTYPGMAPVATGVQAASCSSNLGIPDGPYCKTLANGTLDIGSPLKTALGTPDSTYTSTTKPGVGAGLDGIGDLEYITLASPSQRTAAQYNGRLDANITDKDRISGIIYQVPYSTDSYNGPTRQANSYHHTQINYAYTALWNHTFTPSLLNEARANTSGWRWNEVASNPNVPFGLAQASFVGVGPTEPNYFGPPSPSIFTQWTYGYQDIVTKVFGRQNIKAGATLNRIEFLNESVSNARPAFTFQSFWDFLNDAPYTETGSFNPTTGVPALNRQDDRENIWGVFGQDDFKVTSTLTMNLGLRWSYFGPLTDKQNNFSIVTPGAGSALLTGLTMTQGGPLYTPQHGNFGPQLGLAWNPEALQRKAVIRAGFGINYQENELAITTQGNGNVPGVLRYSVTGRGNAGIVYSLPSDLHTPLAFPSNSHAITTFGANGLPTATTASVTAFDPHVKTITVYHYSLDTELQLPARFVATLGFQGSSAHHLIYQTNLNAYAVAHGIPLNPTLTSVGFYTNGANSNYNALLTTIKHNFARSFQFETQYTWSKSMDEGSSPYAQDAYTPISIHYSYGRSDYNVQNAVRMFGLYQPNFFHERWLHAFADGFSIGGIYNWHTGFPWTPTTPALTPTGASGNLYYVGSPFSSVRPTSYNGAALDLSTNAFESGPSLSNTKPNKNFINGPASYFTTPAQVAVTGTFSAANVGGIPGPAMERNSFNGPMYQDFDVSLAKGINIPAMRILGERARLEVRADMYNVFNLRNVDLPTSSITSTNFGQSQTGLGSRSIEMQARFSF